MKVMIAWDGDHIGREVGRASLADDVEGLRRISQAIDRGNEIWRSWVEKNGGSMISYGGDEGRAELPAEHLSEIASIRDQYASAVSATVSLGIGTKLSEADRALMAAKLRGGNQIVLYTEEVDAEVAEATKKEKTEADKLSEEYLDKAQPGLNQGEGAGMSGAAAPQGAEAPAAPVVEASEHSQGEAAQHQLAEDNPPPPEMTHAAQDLEENFHSLAQQNQQQQLAPEAPNTSQDAIKVQVVKILQALKAQAPILEQIKQTAPDTYAAVMSMAQVVISMAKEMAGDGQHTSLAEIDAGAQSQDEIPVAQNPDEESSDKSDKGGGEKSDKSDTKKSEKHYYKLEGDAVIETDADGKSLGKGPVNKDEMSPECKHFYGKTDKCLRCKAPKTVAKAGLNPNMPAAHHHLNLPVGSHVDPTNMGTREAGKIKVEHGNGKASWVSARAGQVLSQDGHAVSSRNPKGK